MDVYCQLDSTIKINFTEILEINYIFFYIVPQANENIPNIKLLYFARCLL